MTIKQKLALTAAYALLGLVPNGHSQTLIEARASQKRTMDKEFIITSLVSKGFMAGDLGLSIKRISNSHNPCVYEVNPIYGRHPSAGDYLKVRLPIEAGVDFLGYELKKHNSPVWALPHAVSSILSFTGIVSNASSKENWPCHLTR